MTEKDYIRCTYLAKVRAAKSILKDLTPEISGEIDNGEYITVMQFVCRWEEKLSDNIKLKT